jgi:chorismate mutase
MAEALSNAGSANALTLESVRQSLIRQEDTIVFGLIERARFPINSPTYNVSYANITGFSGSLAQFLVRETEALQAKVCSIYGHWVTNGPSLYKSTILNKIV